MLHVPPVRITQSYPNKSLNWSEFSLEIEGKILNQVEYESARRIKYVLVDRTFRIQTVSEWVFQQVIFRSSCLLLC